MRRFNRKEAKNNQQWTPVRPKQPPIPLQKPSKHPGFFSAIPLLPLTKVTTDKLASIHSTDLLQIITLIDLKYRCGSANALSYYPNESDFTPSHYAAWKVLLLRQDISIEEALCRMQDLSQEQASNVARQLIDEQRRDYSYKQAWYQGF